MRRRRRSPPVTRRFDCRARGGPCDRGSSTVEFVVGAAVMVLLLLAVVQVAVYFHHRAVAQTAARHGLDQARITTGSTDQGIAAAHEFLDQSGASLDDRTVSAARTAASSSVTVRGAVVSVVPGVVLTVDVTVDAPTERVTP